MPVAPAASAAFVAASVAPVASPTPPRHPPAAAGRRRTGSDPPGAPGRRRPGHDGGPPSAVRNMPTYFPYRPVASWWSSTVRAMRAICSSSTTALPSGETS